MLKLFALAASLTLTACGGVLTWHVGCGGCGIFIEPPDGGWGAGTCGATRLGDACSSAGATCSGSTSPCDQGLVCGLSDPNCGPPRP